MLFFSISPKTRSLRFNSAPVHRGEAFDIKTSGEIWTPSWWRKQAGLHWWLWFNSHWIPSSCLLGWVHLNHSASTSKATSKLFWGQPSPLHPSSLSGPWVGGCLVTDIFLFRDSFHGPGIKKKKKKKRSQGKKKPYRFPWLRFWLPMQVKDMGSIPGRESEIHHAVEQLSPCTTTREAPYATVKTQGSQINK